MCNCTNLDQTGYSEDTQYADIEKCKTGPLFKVCAVAQTGGEIARKIRLDGENRRPNREKGKVSIQSGFYEGVQGCVWPKNCQNPRASGVWAERAGTAGYGRISMGWRQWRRRPSGRVSREGGTRQPHDRVGGESSLCARHLVASAQSPGRRPVVPGASHVGQLCADPAASDNTRVARAGPCPEGCNDK